MTEYDLSKLKLIAQGGEAEIYDLESDKVLRVIRKPGGKPFMNEQVLFPLLAENHIHFPKVYDYTEVGGKPAEVMQKINGQTMLSYIGHHPLRMNAEIKKLAELHSNILDLQTDQAIYTIYEMVQYFAGQPPVIEQELLNFVLSVFDGLPRGNAVCHGDFHPGNLLMQGDDYYIIDWSGAYRSYYLSDIAHSYLLMKHVPQIPGQIRMQHQILKVVGKHLAERYLKEMQKQKKFEMSEFSKWTVVMDFLRIHFGMPSERPARIQYLDQCYELSKNSVDAANWYKSI